MLTSIAVIVVLLIAAVLIIASTKPDIFRVERSAGIKAPPEKIFPFINDFHSWTQWSPYENKDPSMERTYGAVTSGKGATYAWSGDKNVGQGSMEIADTVPPSKIQLKLAFVKPFKCQNAVEFTLEPLGGETKVTWAMQGAVPFFAKLIHVFINMDKMVGKDFEVGLANLKAAAEKQVAA